MSPERERSARSVSVLSANEVARSPRLDGWHGFPGTIVRCQMSKWGDRPHWGFDAIHLGSDEHGEWIGAPAGTHHTRPGHTFHSAADAVTLVPAGGWYAATFYAPGTWCAVYIDITTPGEWDGTTLRFVDLDLDVVRLADPLPDAARQRRVDTGRVAGEVFVDDEDEFAEHQVGVRLSGRRGRARPGHLRRARRRRPRRRAAVRRHAPALADPAQPD